MITHEQIDLTNATESEAYILKALDVAENRRCVLPIIYKDEVVGGMALVFPDKRPFTEATVETIFSIANQLAVAIHSCTPPPYSGPDALEMEQSGVDAKLPSVEGKLPDVETGRSARPRLQD